MIGLVIVAVAWGGGAPEISRSKGLREGVTVLWPRVVPATEDPQLALVASRVQERVAERAAQMMGAALVESRPSPERVCPQAGCRGTNVSVLVGQEAGGCVVVALIGRAGPTPQTLVPLAGAVDLAGPEVPFREPPESHLVVREFVPCSEVVGRLDLEALGRGLAVANQALHPALQPAVPAP